MKLRSNIAKPTGENAEKKTGSRMKKFGELLLERAAAAAKKLGGKKVAVAVATATMAVAFSCGDDTQQTTNTYTPTRDVGQKDGGDAQVIHTDGGSHDAQDANEIKDVQQQKDIGSEPTEDVGPQDTGSDEGVPDAGIAKCELAEKICQLKQSSTKTYVISDPVAKLEYNEKSVTGVGNKRDELLIFDTPGEKNTGILVCTTPKGWSNYADCADADKTGKHKVLVYIGEEAYEILEMVPPNVQLIDLASGANGGSINLLKDGTADGFITLEEGKPINANCPNVMAVTNTWRNKMAFPGDPKPDNWVGSHLTFDCQ